MNVVGIKSPVFWMIVCYSRLLFIEKKKKKEKFVYSRNRKCFYKSLSPYEKFIRDRRISRESLLHPQQSAWRKLYDSGNNSAMITLTGLDFETFHWLCHRFAPLYDTHSPFLDADGMIVPITNFGKGRQRMMKAEDCLGLNLAWSRLRGSNVVLQMIFGLTGDPVSVYFHHIFIIFFIF
jgi:hypothetical protein